MGQKFFPAGKDPGNNQGSVDGNFAAWNLEGEGRLPGQAGQ